MTEDSVIRFYFIAIGLFYGKFRLTCMHVKMKNNSNIPIKTNSFGACTQNIYFTFET